jgi:hypothetical protein
MNGTKNIERSLTLWLSKAKTNSWNCDDKLPAPRQLRKKKNVFVKNDLSDREKRNENAKDKRQSVSEKKHAFKLNDVNKKNKHESS